LLVLVKSLVQSYIIVLCRFNHWKLMANFNSTLKQILDQRPKCSYISGAWLVYQSALSACVVPLKRHLLGLKLHIISICPRLLCRRSKVSGCLRCGRLRFVMRICRCGDTGANTLPRASRSSGLSKTTERVSERCVRASHSLSHLCNAAYRCDAQNITFKINLSPTWELYAAGFQRHPKENEIMSGVMNLRRVSISDLSVAWKLKHKSQGKICYTSLYDKTELGFWFKTCLNL